MHRTATATPQPRVYSHAWIAFVMVALVGALQTAFTFAHGLAPREPLELSLRIVACVFVVTGAFMAARAYQHRGIVPVFTDHAVVTIVLLAGAWDVVSPFAYGEARWDRIALHVLGGGLAIVLMAVVLLNERPKEHDPYFEQIRATWGP